MPRLARVKPQGRSQIYHLYNRIAGLPGDYPMMEHQARQLFEDILLFYSEIYSCMLVAFAILGNHYHSVILFQAFFALPRAELRQLAVRLYAGKLYKPYLFWREKQWKRFNERLFDVSEFMRNVESAYAVAYNRAFGRRGRLWADRFKSTLLESWGAVQAAALYVEMNPVRAGLVSRPEDYRYGSARLRLASGVGGPRLMPLSELWQVKDPAQAVRSHFAHLYHRGGLRIEREDELIRDIIRQDVEDGLGAGTYRRRHRYFNDGIVIGDKEQVRVWQNLVYGKKTQRVAREPVRVGSGPLCMLRKQRPEWDTDLRAA